MIKMAWKNWSYWLRGGIILSGIAFIALYVTRLTFKLSEILRINWDILGIILWVINLLISMPAIVLRLKIFQYGGELGELPSLYGILIVTIIWFILGAIIGFVIGKIKQKKK